MLCPSFEILAQYYIGQLNQESHQQITSHIAEPCPRCYRKLNWYKEAALAMQTPLQKGPDLIMQRAKDLFAHSRYALPPVQEYFFARLLFDSNNQSNRIGARGAISASPRRLLFHTNMKQITPSASKNSSSSQGFDVDISIKDINEHNFQLRGQILCEQSTYEPIELHIDLYQREELIQSVHTNQHGEFIFTGLIAGEYQLHIKAKQWITVINLSSTMFARKFA